MTDPIRLLVTIVEHGKGERITNLANARHVHFNFILHGRGTASSDILDMLGLGSTEKDVVVCALPRSRVRQMLHDVAEEMRLKRPGTGVAFSLPLSGINELIARIILEEHKESNPENAQDGARTEEGTANMGAEKHWLVLTVVNPGITDQVMAAAKEAGATGGTILHARGVGRENAEAFWAFPSSPSAKSWPFCARAKRGRRSCRRSTPPLAPRAGRRASFSPCRFAI